MQYCDMTPHHTVSQSRRPRLQIFTAVQTLYLTNSDLLLSLQFATWQTGVRITGFR